MTISEVSQMWADWRCPACGKTILHSYLDLVEVGEPVCDCGEDMELMIDE